MEDILASIKRIIAEDGEAATTRATQRGPRKGPAVVPDPVEPVFEADADVETATIAETEPAPRFMNVVEPEPEPVAEPADVLELTTPMGDPPAEPRTDTTMDPTAASILSPSAETASRSAFAALSQLQVRADEGRENTLEGLVGDLLRPMLREWLDRELPAVVERLVAAEITRISGR